MSDAADRRILAEIDSRSWEHPADRAALGALRRVPAFDEILRSVFGFFGEKPVRLAFQANAVRVSEVQFARVHHLHVQACRTLDVTDEIPVFVSQTPFANAGAYGMDRPFVILNSGMVQLLDDEELEFVIAHELAHIQSGHVLYTTMMVILLQLAERGFPIVGLAARAVLVALLEWYRKAELSCDRAGILAVQDPEVGMRTMLKLAGGGRTDDTRLAEFLQQADEYRAGGDLGDQVFKVLNLLGANHPFPVLRAAELRDWVEAGSYDRILRGEYVRRGEQGADYTDDVAEAARGYASAARETVDQVSDAARKMFDSIRTTIGGL
jgi:Zn-dependent protease with chaperone function